MTNLDFNKKLQCAFIITLASDHVSVSHWCIGYASVEYLSGVFKIMQSLLYNHCSAIVVQLKLCKLCVTEFIHYTPYIMLLSCVYSHWMLDNLGWF